ncbi:capsular polysaccharide biosynthesis protein [Rahnella sp. BIGb0603]|uniref:glycosyltransferase family 61 protein n=1 Tax=Rahnella sp. BIGb0603 TaxID=2940612 RepID=UPI0021675689|nr:glycosyltransferase family 61 protein [Rahnella sp. BIGb0603]MCS3423628.1 capsular polysaccharide biosynthesis protein [Rahnella sp. BIGb0603]
MQTLDELGLRLNLSQASNANNYLNSYEKEIETRFDGKCNIVIVSNNNNRIKLSNILLERFPDSNVLVLSYIKDAKSDTDLTSKKIKSINFNSFQELLTWTKNIGLVDIIIEHCSNYKSHKTILFNELFLYLSKNGVYFIEELHAKFITQLNDCEGYDILETLFNICNLKISPPEIKNGSELFTTSLSNHIDEITIKSKLAMVSKKGTTFRGLRSEQASKAFECGALHGLNILNLSTPDILKVKTSFSGNSQKLLNRHRAEIKIPPSYINKYTMAVCFPGQVVYQNNYLLPDSFRMQHHPKLMNKNIKFLDNYFYSLPHDENPEKLLGDYLYLDSEYPGHFGHFTSEVISRLWAWKKLKTTVPNLKVLLSMPKGKGLPSFAKSILNSFGIPDEDITLFYSSICVENLYTASSYYVIGSHVHPEMNEVWSDILKGVKGGETKIKGNKLFIARPVTGGRKCLNPNKMEETFKKSGFEFFSPENYAWEDQIRTFCQAKYIAGYSGSGLFNTMFTDHTKHLISIGSDSYTAVNEHLFCAVKNIHLDYIWADSLIKHGSSWSVKAFMSDYEFNYERDEKHLADILNKLD